MCFSATASFGAAAALTVMGAASVNRVGTDSKYLTLAATPFLFAAHQFSEGVVWVALNSGQESLAQTASLVFLFFALIFWIVWFPFVAYGLETVPWKKRCYAGLSAIGLMFGTYLFIPYITIGLEASICGHSICYTGLGSYAIPQPVRQLIYVSIGVACIFCTDRYARNFFFLVICLGVITKITHNMAWFSVWCFAAAICSTYIYFALRSGGKVFSREAIPHNG